ncbi:MAG: hypothetical protein IT285_00340 [Bdellovibrionales bacterium]|nr:hypothetical protein [Bdellovibrionales bacterium]
MAKVVTEYLVFLRRSRIAVPPAWEAQVVEELAEIVNSMLVKKIYGCLNLQEFQKGLTSDLRRRASTSYKRLKSKAG